MWSEATQTLPRPELIERQSAALRAQVRRVHEHVPFYRDRFAAAGVAPDDIRGVEDIARLPFTAKTDMREVYPLGLSAVPREDLVEVHMSSGTTGKPVVDAYTRGDLAIWGEVMGRTLDMGGVGPGEAVQVAYGYGLFTGGFGAHYGTQALGAIALPMSSGNSARQLTILADFAPVALCCTPSYALFLAEYAREHGIDPTTLPVRAGFFGAEPWSEAMRAQIEAELGLSAYDIYGLTEIIGPGVGAECPEQDGLHIFEDHFYPEVVDPDSGEPLPTGEKGELILTTLTREGTPVLRYRTRDITYLMDDPCPCGRTSRRVHRLMGRTDDMLIVRGVNIFPQQIEAVLLRAQEVAPHYQIVVDRHGAMDSLRVEVEITDEMFSDELGDVLALQHRLEAELHSELGIQVEIALVNPKTITRSEGKAVRVVDRREVKTHV